MAAFAVIRTPPFNSLAEEASRDHPALQRDLDWLEGRLATSPESMGNRVMDLSHLVLPIFKTRCKDSCHAMGASAGWRVYYAVNKEAKKVFLLFIHHKKNYDLPKQGFLLQKIERALSAPL